MSRSGIRQAARNPLRRILRVLLRLRSRPFPLDSASVALVLAPHPDDDALGCGGLLLRKRLQGAAVHIAYLTDGSASHPDHPSMTPERLAAQRQQEAREAARRLGVERAALHFLGAADGSLARLEAGAAEALTNRIAAVLAETRPDEILLPCRRDGSSEHEAAFVLARRARDRIAPGARLLEFPVWAWWNPLRLIRPLLGSRRIWRLDFRGHEKIKAAAVAAHASQVQPLPPDPEPALSPTFLSAFSPAEEFYFES
jgi:LmbE family N-acetylglucosaminyl deacetylase